MTKHYCSSCEKYWNCPQGKDCEITNAILCSKCMNNAKSHTEFGEKQ